MTYMRFGNTIVDVSTVKYSPERKHGAMIDHSELWVFESGDSGAVVKLNNKDADDAWKYLKALESIQTIIDEVKHG